LTHLLRAGQLPASPFPLPLSYSLIFRACNLSLRPYGVMYLRGYGITSLRRCAFTALRHDGIMSLRGYAFTITVVTFMWDMSLRRYVITHALSV